MHHTRGRVRRHPATFGIALVLAVIVAAVFAATAAASPPTGTISESELEGLLQSGAPVTGYFETVLGGATLASQQPVQIPVTVQSIVPDAGPSGDLILFQASGAQIDAIGGIADGMSGSPLYVDDGGVMKLAGAVSYGDYFTTNDLGMATPIDDMTALETTYFSVPGLVRTSTLSGPLATPSGDIASVAVASSRAAAARLDAPASTAVMVPLACVQINGLVPGSPVYKKLADHLTALGLDVSPRSAGVALGLPELPALTGGSSLGVMYSDGDFAVGGLGTVTYVDPDNGVVVAFGHPLDYFGQVSLDLTSAWVQGIWSDSDTPYKVMSPVAVVGEITQDRGAGVAGKLGAGPLEVPVDSSATLGGVTTTSSSTVTEAVVENPNFAGLPSAAAAVAMQRAADAGSFPGSATATVTIKVSDGTGQYTIQRTDVWDDPYDVMSVATGDIDDALGTLTSGVPGVSPTVDSIAFSATLSADHRTATIQDVTAPDGLVTGTNHLDVSLLTADGQTVTVPVTLRIPRGTSTHGTLSVASPSYAGDYSSLDPFGPSAPAAASATPQTLAELVAQINDQPKNSDLDVVYSPDNQGAVVQPVEVLADTHDWYVQGRVAKRTGDLHVMAPSLVRYEQPFVVTGMIGEADASTTVHIYEQPWGRSPRQVATVPAAIDNDGSAMFFAPLPPLLSTTRLQVVWGGDADHLARSVSKTIAVRPRLWLTVPSHAAAGRAVRITVGLRPAQPGGRVYIERRAGSHWVRIADLRATGALHADWRPLPGTTVLRAVFTGSPKSAPATSPTKEVTVR